MKKILLVLAIFACAFHVRAQMITTVAGTGVSGLSGDGGLAAQAQVLYPTDGVVDASGNYYFIEPNGFVIRKIDAVTGIISRYAGTGTYGFSGDGGPATSANINPGTNAGGLAIDASGNLYLSDMGNWRIRKITAATGIITTVAGNGSNGNYGDGGPATSAGLSYPQDVTVDGSGNLYIPVLNGYLVRMVTAATGIITTIAGNGTSGYSGDGGPGTSAALYFPTSVAVDNSGNLYIGDYDKIRKVVLSTGIITTVAGNGSGGDGGPAISAWVAANGLAVDGSGNIYMEQGASVRKITVSTGIINTVAGTASWGYSGDWGLATSGLMNYTKSTAVDNNSNLYITDQGNFRIRKVWSCFNTLAHPLASNQNICQNITAPALSVIVSGTGSIAYQWYSNTTASNLGGTLISGATSSSYIPPSAVFGTTYYYATVTGTCGTVVTNVSGGVTVVPATIISTQPSTSSQTLCVGSTAALSVTATGNGTLTYQWYRNASNSNSGGTLISGATAPSYIPTTLGTYYYYVSVSACNTVVSSPSGAITVIANTAITSSQYLGTLFTICQNATPQYTFSVTATGPGTLTYQWYSNVNPYSSGGTPISGATGTTYLPPASSVVATTYYYVVITSSICGDLASTIGGYNVAAPLSITTPLSTTPVTACLNDPLPPLSLTISGTVLSNYAWYRNTTNSNQFGQFVGNTSTPTLTPPSYSAGTYYYYVGFAGCNSVVSATSGPITVNAPTAVTAGPSGVSQSICQYAAATPLSITATGQNLTYQWYSNPTPSTVGGTLIGGATSSSFTPPSDVVGTKYYYAVATGTCGSATSSASGYINVAVTNILWDTPSVEITQNGSTTLYVNASGPNSQTYQWYSNTVSSNSGGTLISGATSNGYSPPTATIGTMYYYCVVNGCSTVTSNPAAVTVLAPQVIATVAGTGTAGYTGDNSYALAAQISPRDIVVDASGNYYFLDPGSRVVRKVNGSTGIITTVAGNGTSGYSGDGGPATSAQFSMMSGGGLGIDAAGNLYIGDYNNNRIRKVTASTGIITTIAGDGTYGYSGDGGPATSAQLRSPIDVTVDAAGNVYFNDDNNFVIRKVSAAGIITTFAGNGTSGFSGDGGLATSAQIGYCVLAVDNNYLYLGDGGAMRVRKVDLTTGIITSIAGNGTYGPSGDGGPAISAAIEPLSLALDGNGNLFVGSQSNIVRKINLSSGIISRVAGAFNGSGGFSGDYGAATSSMLSNPYDIAVDNLGNIYISDEGNSRIRKVFSCLFTVTKPLATSQTVCQNAAATVLSAASTGSGAISYQWYSNSTNQNYGGTLIGGATGSTFSPPTAATGTTYYYATVTGTCGTLTTSVSGAITVNQGTIISLQPSPTAQTGCYGTPGSLTPLTVTATGSGTLTYNWYRNSTNSNTGGTLYYYGSSSYVPYAYIVGTSYYYVVVSGASGCSVTSNVSGPITILAAPAISTHPSTANPTVCQGATLTTLSVTATGPGLTYQWYSNTAYSYTGSTLIASATNATFVPPTSTPGAKYYYVVVTGTCGNATSNLSGLNTVNPGTAFTLPPSGTGQTVCLNGTITPLTVSATGTGSISYAWYSNTISSSTGGTYVGPGTSYTPPSTPAGTKYYYVVASSSCGGTATSSVSGAITINSLTAITTPPSGSPQSVCLNGTFTTLSVVGSGSGLTYQWYSNTAASNSGGTLIGSATNATYTPLSGTVGTLYYYVIVNGGCGSATSAVSGARTVNPFPSASISPAGVFHTCQESATLTAGAGTSYLWSNGATSQQIEVWNNGNYSVTVTNAFGCSTTSAPTTVSLDVPATPTILYQSYCGYTVLSSSQAGSSYYWSTGQTTPTITVTTNGQYSLAIVVNNCWSGNGYRWVELVQPPPMPQIQFNSYCGYTNLWATTSGPYLWSTGETTQSIYVYSSGNYSLQVASNGCWSSANTQYFSVIDPNTAYGYINQSGDLCSQGQVYLEAGPGSNYYWTNYYWGNQYFWGYQTMIAYAEGWYSVQYTDAAGCQVSASTYVSNYNPSGWPCLQARKSSDGTDPNAAADPVDHGYLFGIYPNPAVDKIMIVLSAPAEADNPVKIFDVMGRLRQTDIIEKGVKEKTIMVQDLEPGIYVVDIKDNKKTRQRKMIIAR